MKTIFDNLPRISNPLPPGLLKYCNSINCQTLAEIADKITRVTLGVTYKSCVEKRSKRYY